MNASSMVKKFKQSFDESTLNALGKATRLCRRERDATPFRLMLSLLQAFGCARLDSIADIHRTFNALSARPIQYKPFHNQLAKPGFASFTREVLSRLLNELAVAVLRFAPDSPFACFEQIRLQDGTSFAVKDARVETFPGRFTTVSPAAVELHVDLDLLSEVANRIVLSPDSMAERPFLPAAHELEGQLLLADRGYFSSPYLSTLDAAGGRFIVRGKSNLKPEIVAAFDATGRPLDHWVGQRLDQLGKRLRQHAWVDLTVRLTCGQDTFDCRLVVHPNLRRGDAPRYLFTNLPRDVFSPEQISDAYRLRWQIELLFKEWKSHANLRAFDTRNPHIAEGLIWASLCAAVLKRDCAHATEAITRVPISTQRVAKCIHHVLDDLFYALVHDHDRLFDYMNRTIDYLAGNARRAHPERDRIRGRLKLGLLHVALAA